jgi:hypothetical protein
MTSGIRIHSYSLARGWATRRRLRDRGVDRNLPYLTRPGRSGPINRSELPIEVLGGSHLPRPSVRAHSDPSTARQRCADVWWQRLELGAGAPASFTVSMVETDRQLPTMQVATTRRLSDDPSMFQ